MVCRKAVVVCSVLFVHVLLSIFLEFNRSINVQENFEVQQESIFLLFCRSFNRVYYFSVVVFFESCK